MHTSFPEMACAPQESGIQLTDFAASYPSVSHTCILSVIEKTELPDFISRFLRSTPTTTSAARGQFLMARGVRQGCPASGFLFCDGH